MFNMVHQPNGEKKVVCTVCAVKLFAKSGGKTTEEALRLSRGNSQARRELRHFTATSHTRSPFKYDEALVQRLIARYILQAEAYFVLPEIRFVELMWGVFRPNYISISRTTNATNYKGRYKETTVELVLSTGNFWVTLTSDLWISQMNYAYCCVIGHWIGVMLVVTWPNFVV